MPKYRSHTTTQGRNMAGARALWRATGMKDGDFGKPIIAVVNSFTQFVPGHVHLKDLLAGSPTLRSLAHVHHDGDVVNATDDDFATEFLDLIISVGVVGSVDEAIEHVNRFGSGHSESIVTRSLDAARDFQQGVDSAVVYVNASTRFTDGSTLRGTAISIRKIGRPRRRARA